jgi:hypothetical protein
MVLQFYREKFLITQWKDGAIFKTKSLGCDWFDEDVVNNPKKNIMYVAANDKFAQMNSTVRRKKIK